MQYIVFFWCGLAILSLVVAIWAVSVRIVDASIIDIFWGFGFVVVAWAARFSAGGPWSLRRTALFLAASLWGMRLTLHLAKRNVGKGEDYRYRAMRKKHGAKFGLISLRTVYLTQGAVMFVVSLPLQVGLMRHDDQIGYRPVVIVGLAVWVVGLAFETVGDLQLNNFVKNPANTGKVLDTGLWAWTRHPNYFGDTCAWWGMWLIACAVRPGLFTVVSPVVMTYMLRKVSGVPMLEHSIAKRRPGYAEYIERTSSFFPKKPRRAI